MPCKNNGMLDKGEKMFSDYKTDEEKYSYCLALDVCSRVKALGIEINSDAFIDGVKSRLSDGKPEISQSEYEQIMGRLFKKIENAKLAQEAKSSDVKEAGDAFRAEHAKKPGVVVTGSGLQIEMLREGTGPMPKATDKVEVHYEGKLINGKIFDSSYKRQQPITFGLNQVIPGWTEGMQHVKVGGKVRLVIPPELAYGSRGAGVDIPPFSTLDFTVELLSIK